MATTRKPAKKKADTSAPIKVLSDKELVLKEYKNAKLEKIKNGLVIFSSSSAEKYPLHSGIAATESDAWKLAAQVVL